MTATNPNIKSTKDMEWSEDLLNSQYTIREKRHAEYETEIEEMAA